MSASVVDGDAVAAVPVGAAVDFWAEWRARAHAFLLGSRDGGSLASVLPLELFRAILALSMPRLSTALVVGPHHGEMWIRRSSSEAVVKMGPSIVTSAEAITEGRLVWRLALRGRGIAAVGAVQGSGAEGPLAMWNGTLGFRSGGWGSPLRAVRGLMAEGAVTVCLDADARRLMLNCAGMCYACDLPPPEATLPGTKDNIHGVSALD
eukprot:m51a1_g13603 hypothetical protein (207) ;mRNA; r:57-978